MNIFSNMFNAADVKYFWTHLAAEIILFQFQTWLHVK